MPILSLLSMHKHKTKHRLPQVCFAHIILFITTHYFFTFCITISLMKNISTTNFIKVSLENPSTHDHTTSMDISTSCILILGGENTDAVIPKPDFANLPILHTPALPILSVRLIVPLQTDVVHLWPEFL